MAGLSRLCVFVLGTERCRVVSYYPFYHASKHVHMILLQSTPLPLCTIFGSCTHRMQRLMGPSIHLCIGSASIILFVPED